MNVSFTIEEETRIAKVAAEEGTDSGSLVRNAVLRFLEQEADFEVSLDRSIAQADRGEFIEEEEMDGLFEKMLRS